MADFSSNWTSSGHSVIHSKASRALFWLLLQRLWSGVAVIPSLATLLFFIIVILAKDRISEQEFNVVRYSLHQIMLSAIVLYKILFHTEFEF